MIIIKSENSNSAWRETLKSLFCEGSVTDNKKYFRDELSCIEISNPSLLTKDPLFPMTQESIDVINHFIISGENEYKVTHEWTKLYYHRMFDEPHSQIKYFIKFLQQRPLEGEALISMWDKNKDQNTVISPCTETIWGRIKFNKLEIHVHAHSSDAYKKLLMNIQEFISLHIYLAKQLDVELGGYFHIIDSCHIHTEDIEKAEKLISAF